MNNTVTGITSQAVLISLLTFCSYAQASTDLAKTFVGMDKDCALLQPATHAMLKWLMPTYSGKLTKTPPPELSGVVGTPKLKDAGDYWQVEVPLKDATYKGFPLVRIERWTGKDNGISGYALVFHSKVADVAKKIKTPKYEVEPDEEVTLPVWETTTQKPGSAMLSCDFST